MNCSNSGNSKKINFASLFKVKKKKFRVELCLRSRAFVVIEKIPAPGGEFDVYRANKEAEFFSFKHFSCIKILENQKKKKKFALITRYGN